MDESYEGGEIALDGREGEKAPRHVLSKLGFQNLPV